MPSLEMSLGTLYACWAATAVAASKRLDRRWPAILSSWNERIWDQKIQTMRLLVSDVFPANRIAVEEARENVSRGSMWKGTRIYFISILVEGAQLPLPY